MNEKMKVERGIPLPAGKMQRKYPFAEMQIGDSFLIDGDLEVTRNRISASAKYAGIKIATRKVEGGMRVWRIA